MDARQRQDLGDRTTISILLLEDSAIDADLIGEHLVQAELPHRITRVCTRDDFTRAVESGAYDLILADHALPGFDGLAALAIARERAPAVPFIFVSGTLGEETAIECLKRGATDYVVKPRLQRLPSVVARALAEAREKAERIRAEEALQVALEAARASEKRLRLVTDALPVLICYVDVDRRYRFNNRAYQDWFGYGPDEIQGRHVRDVVGEKAYEVLRPNIDAALAGQRATVEALAPYKDGGPRYIKVDYVPDVGPSGHVAGYYALIEDVTERRRAEDALRASEQRFRRLIEISSTGVVLIRADARIEFANKTFLDMVGYTEADLREGRLLRDDLTPPGYKPPDWVLGELAERGVARPFERVVVAKDGRHVPTLLGTALLDGSLERGDATLAVFVTDLTALKEAERSLRESEHRLRLAVEATELGIWDWDIVAGRTNATDRVRALIGLPSDGKPNYARFLAQVEPADRPDVEAAITRALDPEGAGHYEVEYRVCRDDEIRWVAARGQTLFETVDGSRRAVRFLGTIQDVTPRKRAEEHQKLLIAELSHRVKNTLATVLSIAAQTLHSTPSPEAFHKAFVARVTALSQTHSLLSRSNWEGALLRDVILAEVRPYLDGEASRMMLDGADVQLDPRAALSLGMAFHELATNAAKYGALSLPSGRVAVSWTVTEEADGAETLSILWSESGGPEVRKPRRKGFGSTLIERGIAHELDGEVSLVFDPSGVQCEIEIPMLPASAEPDLSP